MMQKSRSFGLFYWSQIRRLAARYGCDVSESRGFLVRRFTFSGIRAAELIADLDKVEEEVAAARLLAGAT
jgi:hypothetical protein